MSSSFQAVSTAVLVYPHAPVSSSLTSAVVPSPWSLLTLIARSSSENDNDGDDSSPSISRSSSLLFGFLITFLALFIGFMACGYSSRRTMRLNQAAVAHMGGMNHYREFSYMKKPRIWEVWIAEVAGKERWKNMMPLSASLAPSITSPPPSLDVIASSTTMPDRRENTSTRWDHLSAYFSRSSRRQHNFASPPRHRTTPGIPPRPPPTTNSRPAYDPNPPNSFVLPPTDFRLPPQASLFSVLEREWSRSRSRSASINEERRRGRGHVFDADANASSSSGGEKPPKEPATHARISVLIAMPRSGSSNSSTESSSRDEKAQGAGPDRQQHNSDQPWADYELGVAHVPLSPPRQPPPGAIIHDHEQRVQAGGG